MAKVEGSNPFIRFIESPATDEEVLADHLDADPEYRREWERTALARAVAVKVIAYRAEHELSQTALAKRLKMSQPAVARLESGEHSPTFPMLLRISDALGVELAIDITPSGHEPQRLSGVPSRGSGGSFARTSAATRGRGPARGARSAQCDLARRRSLPGSQQDAPTARS
jgi:transcriptional regulator with XRE-family HTH domain